MRNLATATPAVNDVAQPFADGWRSLQKAGGVAVVNKPLSNEALWPNWQKRGAWRQETLEQEAARRPTSNLGVSCGASGVTVIDIDSSDPGVAVDVIQEFGETPVMVHTPSGGLHLYYRASGEGCGSFRQHPDARYRWPVDIKGKGGQVVCPPSVRPHGSYRFVRSSDWPEPFAKLPLLPAGHPALAPFRRSETPVLSNVERLRPGAGGPIVGAGSRNDVLRDHVLRGLAPYNGAHREAVEIRALALANELIQTGAIDTEDGHAFTDADVRRAISSAITYTVEGRNFHGLKGGSRGRVLSDIGAVAGNGDAFLLLALLRETHALQAFSLAPVGMAEAVVIPGWGRKRYMAARDVLLGAGLLVQIYRGGTKRGDASRYKLA